MRPALTCASQLIPLCGPGISMIIQDRVESVDPEAHTVTLSGGADVELRQAVDRHGIPPDSATHSGTGFAGRPFLLDPGGWQEYRRQGRHRLRRYPDGSGLYRFHHPGGAGRARGEPDGNRNGRSHGAAYDGPDCRKPDKTVVYFQGRQRVDLNPGRIHRTGPMPAGWR